jgi:hypothetical protein
VNAATLSDAGQDDARIPESNEPAHCAVAALALDDGQSSVPAAKSSLLTVGEASVFARRMPCRFELERRVIAEHAPWLAAAIASDGSRRTPRGPPGARVAGGSGTSEVGA